MKEQALFNEQPGLVPTVHFRALVSQLLGTQAVSSVWSNYLFYSNDTRAGTLG
jgi:hypothetical protein